MQNYKNLHVWKASNKLTINIYEITACFPKHESYALTSQIRRASYSIPCNIVEGSARGNDNELRYFLRVAFGSAAELLYLIELSHSINYLDDKMYRNMREEIIIIQKMLNKFISRLKPTTKS